LVAGDELYDEITGVELAHYSELFSAQAPESLQGGL
jgi:hypothetical protein